MKQYYDTNEAFDLYRYYLAIRRHFESDDYDFFKYKGKVNASLYSFEKRRDRFFFYKLTKQKRDPKGFILANILNGKKTWIGDMMDNEAEEVYRAWRKKWDSLSYTFQSDLRKLDPDFNANFTVPEGDLPPAMKLYMYDKITLETVTILDLLLNFSPRWGKKVVDTLVFPDINRRITKYKPFLDRKIDKAKFKRMVLDEFNTTPYNAT